MRRLSEDYLRTDREDNSGVESSRRRQVRLFLLSITSIMLSVFISGANGGLGLGTVRNFAARSSTSIFAGARNVEGLKELLRDVKVAQDSSITPVELDVTNEVSIAAAVQTVRETLNGAPLQILINNAGINATGPLKDAYTRVLAVNVVGSALVTEAFLPLMTGTRPTIVNVSSNVGSLSAAADPATHWFKMQQQSYAVSKVRHWALFLSDDSRPR